MKTKSLLLLAMFVAMATNVFAGIITVSNNPNSPGQYTTIQAAIDAANLGDTLMIAGSATAYYGGTTTKPLVFVGAGYNNPYGLSTSVTYLSLNRASEFLGASGTKIMGIAFGPYGGITINPSYGGSVATNLLNNILIERCKFECSTYNWVGLTFNLGGCTSINDTVRNCLFYGAGCASGGVGINFNVSDVSVHKIFVHNNIFDYARITTSGIVNNFYLRNNIFINQTSIFSNVNSMIIENNIFYGANPVSCTNCAFTKNISYLASALPGSGNIGSGNMNATNPMFVNYPVTGGGFSWSYDFHLQAGSPGKNAGTDGTDIGIYGGMLPYDVGANPHFPQMMELTLPSGSSVPAGGTLNVHFKARKQN